MKRLTIIFAVLLTATSIMAQTFKIGKLTFEIAKPTTVRLTDADEDITKVFLSDTIDYEGNSYTLTYIGYEAFKGCKSLTSVTIPNSVTSIGVYAFEGTTLYNDPANWENGALYVDNCLIEVDEGFAGHFRIKENTRVIADYAFKECTSLTSVTIPNSVTSIGNLAFADCSSLTSVTIPNSVTSIVFRAFSGCKSLKSVVISNSITNIGDFAFYGCSSLTSVTIPNSVTSIEGWAFKGCKSLTSVTIPNSVTSIGGDAFEGTALYNNPANWENGALYIDNCLIKVAKGLVGHFRIKENTRIIANNAFEGCTSLTSVTIPNSVTSIGYGAFRYCSLLTSVTIPNSVTSIGSSAFASCTSLTSVTIPNSVTMIENHAFYDCNSLKSITIPNSVTSIGYGAFRGTALYNDPANWENGALYIDNCLIEVDEGFAGHFRIKENTRVIAGGAFNKCTSLTSVTIPNSVTSIGNEAFKDCESLTSVTIPNSVTSIGLRAFPWHTQIIRE